MKLDQRFHLVLAKIDTTTLGDKNAPVFTSWLNVSYSKGVCQSIGGYTLDTPTKDADGKFLRREGHAYGMEFIIRTLRACGAGRWEDLPGRTIYVLKESDAWGAPVLGIAPLPTEPGEPFIFAELAEQFQIAGDGDV